MTDYKVTDAQLSGIASAIRTKGGTSAPLVFPSGFVSAINAIDASAVLSDITISQNGSYSAAGEGVDGFANVVVDVQGGGGSSEEATLCKSIASSAYSETSITRASFPNCKRIGDQAFSKCFELSEIYFPECTYVGVSAFYRCSSLTRLDLPKCTFVDMDGFKSCIGLSEISLPACTSLNASAFGYCTGLTEVYLPSCIYVGGFLECTNLSRASFPVLSTLSTKCFSGCYNLKEFTIPETCTRIFDSAFYMCSSLESVYVLCTSIPRLDNYVFDGTPIMNSSHLGYYGSIYVPSSMYSNYITNTYWSKVASRITSITE